VKTARGLRSGTIALHGGRFEHGYHPEVDTRGSARPIGVRVWIAWATANAAGVTIVALPDTGPRIVSFGEAHGPSVLDAIGSLLVIAGWASLEVAIWRGRERLRDLPRRTRVLGMALIVAGLAILIPTIVLSLGAWWVVGVLLLVAVQLAAAVAVSIGR
jgi:hypothetical protein